MLFTNVWYIAEASETLTADKPLKVKMLGREFVLFRDSAGRAHCLSNVCCHRGAALSLGKCHDDDTLACPFHGWRFTGEGRCTMVPSQERPRDDIPAMAKVDAYPTEERYGFIWVFLGDRPEEAHPLFEIPEFDDPAWRMVRFDDTWKANVHVAKMVDLDQVHLHIVHGIPLNEENPSRPGEHAVTWDDRGFGTHIVSRPPPRGGSWQKLRTERASVNSYLNFYVPGFTLYGRIEIAAGFSNVFYSMHTPIDEENSHLWLLAFRNFMLEPDKDKDHLERNLRNIYQDKAIAESVRPKRAPDQDEFPKIPVDREDRLMQAYWQLLRDLRGRGWQIDRMALEELDRDGDYRVIPSPARRRDPAAWVYGAVPTLGGGSRAGARALSSA